MTKKDKTTPDSKEEALRTALAQIEKQFGRGSIMKMDEIVEEMESCSTGSLKIDAALGIGGLPYGRIVEIFGPESSGKTTLSLSVIAEAQKAGKTCLFIDAENALDVSYARKLGVDVNKMIISQPDSGEQALNIAETMANSGAVDIIVVDSVAALVPRAELEGEVGDSHVGLAARMMSQGLRKLTGVVKKNNVLLIFINQIRMKIGVMYGSPETTTGGNALKFYASVRLDIRKVTSLKKNEDVYGNEVKVKVIKNKVAPPFKEAVTEIIFNQGFNRVGEILDIAVKLNVVDKAGAWYSYNGNKIGQGKDNVVYFLKENPAIQEEILDKISTNKNDFVEEGLPEDD